MQLTEKVRRKVVDEIIAGKYSLGERIPTEREMAVETGTSRITVRRAYSQLERAGIITRRPSAGTCVSDAFKGNDDEIEQIAALATLRDPFALEFIEQVNRSCREEDILNILSVAEMESQAQAETAASLAAKGIRNLIVWGFDCRFDLSVFERLRILGINMVFFDRVRPGPFADYVGLDNRAAANAIAEAAIDDGVETAVFVDLSNIDVDSNRERREAVIDSFKRRGVPCELRGVPYPVKPEGVAGEAKSLLQASSSKLGVVCINDSVALALRAFLPASSLIYSVDGSDEAAAKGISSYSQPMKEMAAACVESLKSQQRLGRKWKARSILFKGSLRRPAIP